MLYNFVADSFHTKKLCSRLSSSEVRFYTGNGRFAFLSPMITSERLPTMQILVLIGTVGLLPIGEILPLCDFF